MRRRVLILLAAIVLAGLSASAVRAYTRTVDQRAIAGKQGVWVLVAAKEIAKGTTAAAIRTGDTTKRVLMPAETVPAGTLGKLDASMDALTLTSDLQTGQLVMRAQFAAAIKPAERVEVPPGKLAVSVQLTIGPQVAGNVVAGSQVTVFDTYPAVPTGTEQQVTRVLLPRTTVISVGAGDTAPSPTASGAVTGPETDSSGGAYLVTLAVDEKEAVRLVHAARTGLLYLALLNDSTDVTDDTSVDNEGLFS